MRGTKPRVESSVRRMEPRDAEAVWRLAAGLPDAAQWGADDFRRTAGGEYDSWVVECGVGIAGFLVARCMNDEMEILNMGVAPERRRNKIGTHLLEAALSAARAKGTRKAYLEVRASNGGAIAFYARAGFQRTGRRRNYYAVGREDAVVMCRSLD